MVRNWTSRVAPAGSSGKGYYYFDRAEQIVMALEGGIMLARLRKDEKPLRLCFDTLKVLLQ
jgi:hypothetical protein